MNIEALLANVAIPENQGVQANPVTGESISNNGSYYRSRIFNSVVGINPLIAAAAPLFTCIAKFKKVNLPQDAEKLLQDLSHEIHAFEHKAQIKGYHSTIIVAARYALCCALDETIKATEQLGWNNNLLMALSHESLGHERFFDIVERAYDDPALNIDLLELFYLCLNLGFQGKFRNQEKGHQELTAITDRLYHFITKQRGEVNQELFISEKPHKKVSEVSSTTGTAFFLIVIALVISGLIYACGALQLHNVMQPLISKIDAQSQSITNLGKSL